MSSTELNNKVTNLANPVSTNVLDGPSCLLVGKLTEDQAHCTTSSHLVSHGDPLSSSGIRKTHRRASMGSLRRSNGSLLQSKRQQLGGKNRRGSTGTTTTILDVGSQPIQSLPNSTDRAETTRTRRNSTGGLLPNSNTPTDEQTRHKRQQRRSSTGFYNRSVVELLGLKSEKKKEAPSHQRVQRRASTGSSVVHQSQNRTRPHVAASNDSGNLQQFPDEKSISAEQQHLKIESSRKNFVQHHGVRARRGSIGFFSAPNPSEGPAYLPKHNAKANAKHISDIGDSVGSRLVDVVMAIPENEHVSDISSDAWESSESSVTPKKCSSPSHEVEDMVSFVKKGSTETLGSNSSTHTQKQESETSTENAGSMCKSNTKINMLDAMEYEPHEMSHRRHRIPRRGSTGNDWNAILENEMAPQARFPRRCSTGMDFRRAERRKSLQRAQEILGLESDESSSSTSGGSRNNIGGDEWLIKFLNEGYHEQKKTSPKKLELDFSCLENLHNKCDDADAQKPVDKKQQVEHSKKHVQQLNTRAYVSPEYIAVVTHSVRKLARERCGGHRRHGRRASLEVTSSPTSPSKPQFKRHPSF